MSLKGPVRNTLLARSCVSHVSITTALKTRVYTSPYVNAPKRAVGVTSHHMLLRSSGARLRQIRSAEYKLRERQLAWLSKNLFSTDGLTLDEEDENLRKISETYTAAKLAKNQELHDLRSPEGVEVEDDSSDTSPVVPGQSRGMRQSNEDGGLVYVNSYDPSAVLAEYLRCNPALAKDTRRVAKLSVKQEARPPVVSVMGHVDHGKTTLLDALRNASVAASETGGITQRIGAFEVSLGDAEATFVDTPGHEAFKTMRSAAAQATDVIVCVISAPDGIRPQTREVLSLARTMQCPVVVALTKLDMGDADMERLHLELQAEGFTPEDDGGDTQIVPVVAPKGEGLTELVEAISLAAELCDPPPTAPTPSRAEGVVLESDATERTLSVVCLRGSFIPQMPVVCGQGAYVVQRIVSSVGDTLKQTKPSQPVQLVVREAGAAVAGAGRGGNALLPVGGSPVVQVPTAAEAKAVATHLLKAGRSTSGSATVATKSLRSFVDAMERMRRSDVLDLVTIVDADGEIQGVDEGGAIAAHATLGSGGRVVGKKVVPRIFLNVVLVADSHGSLAAAVQELDKLPVCEVCLRVIAAETVGAAIPLSVLRMAEHAGAMVLAFRCDPSGESEPNPRPPPVFTALPTGRCHAYCYPSSAPSPGLFDRVYRCDRKRFDPMVTGVAPPQHKPFEGNLPVFQFEVLYDLLHFARAMLEYQLPVATRLVQRGQAHVQAVFPKSWSVEERQMMREGMLEKFEVAGCACESGLLLRTAPRIEVIRQQRVILYASKLYSLRHFKKEVDEIESGKECGIAISGYLPQVGDKIRFLGIEYEFRSLEDSVGAMEAAGPSPDQAK
eukprot:TRINITY_DN22188_c0_g1_i1.p1 TRINITY_DN22188_c0_g1~~TRINITY_DN22188_c0_g1_i1.p1  ORF type:complete len:839 (-),score=225.20 TRINITY_DN22188_c0_g1_i1:205-2721(-)